MHCANGILARASALVSRLRDATGIFIVSSPTIWKHCGRAASSAFRGLAHRQAILFNDAETEKRLAIVEELCRALIHLGADRRAVIVAVGGGVVGDVVGFAAASYLRGVRLVHIPTTLVAQIDSSIGGKTGVNLPEGKNLIGAFYPPQMVITDPDLLNTLPHREFRSGLYEVVKTGIIADVELFAFLERHMLSCLRRDPETLASVIVRCIRVKANVIGRDERESSLRQILNFGHTFGHALETFTGYRRFLHGEAVGWGMCAATLLALATGRLAARDAARILRSILSVGHLPALPKIPAAKLRALLAGDKKSRGGRIRWVLPRRIGSIVVGVEVPWPLVSRVVGELPGIVREAQNQTRVWQRRVTLTPASETVPIIPQYNDR